MGRALPRAPRDDTTAAALILQRYILRQLLTAFVFAVGGMLFIALPAIAVAAVHRLAGVETAAIVLFIPLLMFGLVPYILPLGYLLATVVTFGRLAADKEWTAIRMAGIQPLWMVAPPLALALLCSLGTSWLVSTKLPRDQTKQRQYQVEVLQRTITNLSPGRTELRIGEFLLKANERRGNEFRQVFIHIPGSGDRGSQTMLADSLTISVDESEQMLVVRLRDARVVHGQHAVRNEQPVVTIDLKELVKPQGKHAQAVRYKTSDEVREMLAVEDDPRRVSKMRYTLHHRMAIATTYVMFCLLGVSTGLLLRRGTQLAALSVAVGYALVYYLTVQLVKPLAEAEQLHPVVAAWAANAGAGALGLVLMWRAFRE